MPIFGKRLVHAAPTTPQQTTFIAIDSASDDNPVVGDGGYFLTEHGWAHLSVEQALNRPMSEVLAAWKAYNDRTIHRQQ